MQQQQQQHPFNDLSSRTTQVSQYQKGKTNRDLLEQEKVSGSCISWAICKSTPQPRQISMSTPTTQFLQVGCRITLINTVSFSWKILIQIKRWNHEKYCF